VTISSEEERRLRQTFGGAEGDVPKLLREYLQLRADLERVTAEREQYKRVARALEEQKRQARADLIDPLTGEDWKSLAHDECQKRAALAVSLERVTAERDLLKAEREDVLENEVRWERELAETKAALELEHNRCCNAIGEREVARAELAHLQRAWALHVLENQGTPSERWLSRVPESVAALIRSGAGKPIGECESCEKKAPLIEDVNQDCAALGCDGTHKVCAPGWVCSP
jgi:hypothetical protein